MPEVSNNYDLSLEHQFRGDVSMKVTPFWRSTQNQIQQFFLNQSTNFVSGLNVGKQTSRGIEFELDKGNFAAQGVSARLTLAYTNSYIQYTPLSNGTSVLTPINAQIANYNAYTSGCAAGGKYAGTSLCGTTVSGQPASACYTTAGVAAACGAGTVANPYFNAPTQGLLPLNGNYPTFDLLPGSALSGPTSAYGAPYTATFVINERVGKWAVAPIVQMFAGQRYGAPFETIGIAPDKCTATLAGTPTGDPRYPYGAPGGSPFDASACGFVAAGIPNQSTGQFDGIGAFSQPTQLQLHLQASYDVSKNVTLIANLTNIVNTCFGGSKVAWAVSQACGYVGELGAGTAAAVGNGYNPGSAIQPVLSQPYQPFFSGLPFSVFFNARIKM